MKKTDEKKKGYIIISAMALFIGLVIALQISTVQGSDLGGLVTVSETKAYEEKLKSAIAEKEEIVKELTFFEEKITEIENSKAEEDFFLKGVINDLEKYKIAAGIVDVHGPGVKITIDDPMQTDDVSEDISTIMVNYELLLNLVNKLKEAGAEAISVNEQRIIASTEISLAGNHVNINANPTAPPYEIKAIGDPHTIYAAITIRYGIIDEMKDKNKYGLQVMIEQKDEIIVTGYDDIIKFKYANPIKSIE